MFWCPSSHIEFFDIFCYLECFEILLYPCKVHSPLRHSTLHGTLHGAYVDVLCWLGQWKRIWIWKVMIASESIKQNTTLRSIYSRRDTCYLYVLMFVVSMQGALSSAYSRAQHLALLALSIVLMFFSEEHSETELSVNFRFVGKQVGHTFHDFLSDWPLNM